MHHISCHITWIFCVLQFFLSKRWHKAKYHNKKLTHFILTLLRIFLADCRPNQNHKQTWKKIMSYSMCNLYMTLSILASSMNCWVPYYVIWHLKSIAAFFTPETRCCFRVKPHMILQMFSNAEFFITNKALVRPLAVVNIHVILEFSLSEELHGADFAVK